MTEMERIRKALRGWHRKVKRGDTAIVRPIAPFTSNMLRKYVYLAKAAQLGIGKYNTCSGLRGE